MENQQDNAVDENIRLTPEESEQLVSVLNTPRPPNQALRDAMERFKARAAGSESTRH